MADVDADIMAYLRQTASETGSDIPVTPETGLMATGLLDSMALVGLIRFIDEKFGIDIPDDDMDPDLFSTPTTVADYVKRRLAA